MSLQEYLNRRYFAASGLLVLISISLISFMNYSGMDDTTEYYMLYEGEVLTEHYPAFADILESDPGVKEYYWGDDNLPSAYKDLIVEQTLVPNRAMLFSVEHGHLYVMPYVGESRDMPFYIIHWFPYDEFAVSNERLKLMISGFAILLLVFVMAFVSRSNRNVSHQLQEFDLWLKALGKRPLSELQSYPMSSNIRFSELIASGETVFVSLEKQHELQQKQAQMVQREKEFLASLSHELRTPIAVIAAAISLMKKRDKLSDKDKSVLEKLAKANGNMKLLTTTILQVWRKQESPTSNERIELAELMAVAIDDCKSYSRGELEFKVEINERLTISTDPTLVRIVFDNLLRNACQYADEDRVDIVLSGTKLKIENGHANNDRDEVDGLPYGYGFGLYLVETICRRHEWPITVSDQAAKFTVEISFGPGAN